MPLSEKYNISNHLKRKNIASENKLIIIRGRIETYKIFKKRLKYLFTMHIKKYRCEEKLKNGWKVRSKVPYFVFIVIWP